MAWSSRQLPRSSFHAPELVEFPKRSLAQVQCPHSVGRLEDPVLGRDLRNFIDRLHHLEHGIMHLSLRNDPRNFSDRFHHLGQGNTHL